MQQPADFYSKLKKLREIKRNVHVEGSFVFVVAQMYIRIYTPYCVDVDIVVDLGYFHVFQNSWNGNISELGMCLFLTNETTFLLRLRLVFQLSRTFFSVFYLSICSWYWALKVFIFAALPCRRLLNCSTFERRAFMWRRCPSYIDVRDFHNFFTYLVHVLPHTRCFIHYF